MDQSQIIRQTLDLLRDTYNYNHWIYSMLRPYLGDRVLEIGSGQGNITRFLLDRTSLVCLEPEEGFVHSLRELGAVHRNLQVFRGSTETIPCAEVPESGFDTVVCLNVLEHIRDDRAALKTLQRVLKVGGILLLYVPACMWAFGELDVGLGHHRRYGRRVLRSQAAAAGFDVLRCRYVNLPGLIGWWWQSRVRKHRQIDPADARAVDRIVPYLSAVERLFPPLAGQSLFLIGRRRSGSSTKAGGEYL